MGLAKRGSVGFAMAVFVLFSAPKLSFSGSRLNHEQLQKIELYKQHAAEFLRTARPDLAENALREVLAIDPTDVDARANLGVILFFQGDYLKAAPELREALKHEPALWKIQALLGMCEMRIGQPARARADLEKSFPHLKAEKLRLQAGMELVETYYQAGDLERAASTLTILRKLEPEDVNILYMAHRVYMDLADQAMLTVALVAPKSARMQQMMAEQLARHGKIESAIVHFRKALKIDPHLPGVHFELGEEFRNSSIPDHQKLAEQQYKDALAEDPFDEKSECRLGDIDLERSDPKHALGYYSRALKLQPNDFDANLGAGEALIAMGQLERAEPLLVRAIRLDPSDPSAHYRLATLYLRLGRRADADREFARFKTLKDLQERLGDIYQEMSLQPKSEKRVKERVPK